MSDSSSFQSLPVIVQSLGRLFLPQGFIQPLTIRLKALSQLLQLTLHDQLLLEHVKVVLDRILLLLISHILMLTTLLVAAQTSAFFLPLSELFHILFRDTPEYIVKLVPAPLAVCFVLLNHCESTLFHFLLLDTLFLCPLSV